MARAVKKQAARAEKKQAARAAGPTRESLMRDHAAVRRLWQAAIERIEADGVLLPAARGGSLKANPACVVLERLARILRRLEDAIRKLTPPPPPENSEGSHLIDAAVLNQDGFR